LFFPVLAFGVVVSLLPPGEFADTEVATNLPFAVDLETMTRVDFTLDLDASPTNAVEVSVGNDANGDGNLSPYEADVAFGYDCGQRFVRKAVDDSQTFEPECRIGNVTRSFLLRKPALNVSWNLVKVVRRGHGPFLHTALAEGRKPGYVLEVR